jgi:hypothetical protein
MSFLGLKVFSAASLRDANRGLAPIGAHTPNVADELVKHYSLSGIHDLVTCAPANQVTAVV